GGTTGILQSAGEPLGDVQVTVYRMEGGTPQLKGSAITRLDGTFELVTKGAQGPLWLSPGDYRFTLETAGSPVEFPPEYAQAEMTPLVIQWSAKESELRLSVPPGTN
ncbi:MAG: hypothetical protein ACKV0T_21535, partial [Planctomycetales bacterium]